MRVRSAFSRPRKAFFFFLRRIPRSRLSCVADVERLGSSFVRGQREAHPRRAGHHLCGSRRAAQRQPARAHPGCIACGLGLAFLFVFWPLCSSRSSTSVWVLDPSGRAGQRARLRRMAPHLGAASPTRRRGRAARSLEPGNARLSVESASSRCSSPRRRSSRRRPRERAARTARPRPRRRDPCARASPRRRTRGRTRPCCRDSPRRSPGTVQRGGAQARPDRAPHRPGRRSTHRATGSSAHTPAPATSGRSRRVPGATARRPPRGPLLLEQPPRVVVEVDAELPVV